VDRQRRDLAAGARRAEEVQAQHAAIRAGDGSIAPAAGDRGALARGRQAEVLIEVDLDVFTRRADIMGVLVNRRLTTGAVAVVATLIVGLNIFLLHQTFLGT
jgi:hypothetical protein